MTMDVMAEEINPDNVTEGDAVRFVDKNRGSKFDDHIGRTGVVETVRDRPLHPIQVGDLVVRYEFENGYGNASIKFEDVREVLERDAA